MNDGLPTEEQLRRIRIGVFRRIDARRTIARRIAGAAVAVVLVGGGVGLVASGFHGMAGASGGAAGSGGSVGGAPANGAPASQSVAVRCALTAGSDEHRPTRVEVPRASLPQGAVTACARGAAPARASGGDTGAQSAPRITGVLCTDVDGSLVVLAVRGSATSTCVRAGMEPYTR